MTRYQHGRRPGSLHKRARFQRRGRRWIYIDDEQHPTVSPRHIPVDGHGAARQAIVRAVEFKFMTDSGAVPSGDAGRMDHSPR